MADNGFLIETGAVASIDINRPDEGNRFTGAAMVRLADDIAKLAADEATRVIVLKGRGDHFCAGRDRAGEDRSGMTPYRIRLTMDRILNVYRAIDAASVPVIARVHGSAIGFGAALAGGCDISIASDSARFAFNEIKHGVPPTLAMSAVMRKVPEKALAYMVYSGDEIDAYQALANGLLSRVIAKADFEKEVDAFIKELATHPRLILETVKRYQKYVFTMPASTATEYAGTLLALIRSS